MRARPYLHWWDRAGRAKRYIAKNPRNRERPRTSHRRTHERSIGNFVISNPDDIRDAYAEVKNACKAGWTSTAAADALIELAILSLRFLESEGTPIDLVSNVPDKEYMSYRLDRVVARPANKRFYLRDEREVGSLWRSWAAEDDITEERLACLLYTVALAPCLVMELLDRQNKKGPATYFECLVGHLFATSLGTEPDKTVTLPVHGRSVRMTMDFLFDMGSGQPNIHLPVKMSTRERVVQAWSHQRLLESAYGKGSYIGVMVIFSETKLNSRSLEVVGICVPNQWLVYQTLLAKMENIYYFDRPSRYEALTNRFPDVIQIGQFADYFVR